MCHSELCQVDVPPADLSAPLAFSCMCMGVQLLSTVNLVPYLLLHHSLCQKKDLAGSGQWCYCSRLLGTWTITYTVGIASANAYHCTLFLWGFDRKLVQESCSMNNSSKGFCCVLKRIVQQRQWCDLALYRRTLLSAYPHVQNVNNRYLKHAGHSHVFNIPRGLHLSAVPSFYLLAGTLLMLLSHKNIVMATA